MKACKNTSAGGKGSHPALRWNQPDVKLRLNENVYVDMLNCFITAAFGCDAHKLESLLGLPQLMSLYERFATWCRDRCLVDDYFLANQVVCLLKKVELTLFDDAAENAAYAKWLDAEAACKEMNEKCRDIFLHPLTHSQAELQAHIIPVRDEIAKLLGDFPPDLDEVSGFMKFGPGSTLSHPHRKGAVVHKLLPNHTAYSGMKEEVDWLLNSTGLFAEALLDDGSFKLSFSDLAMREPSVQYGDEAKLDFVPKSIFEKRTIEIGPSLAVLFQQAYDGFLRRRLLEWGIDLTTQVPNQHLAFVGSLRGDDPSSPCTIDLSSASDRVSFGIVAMLLPKSWTATLLRYRAKSIRYGETSHTLEKFASMGNSLTFSLQTLIYAAVVRSVLRERGLQASKWRVYGDDIIAPRSAIPAIVTRLEAFGFKINTSKSFFHGYFRESCGADYLRGMNVRPLYIKKPLKTVADLYKVLNLIQLTAIRVPNLAYAYEPLYRMVLALVPKNMKIFGDTRKDLDSCIWSPWVDDDACLCRRTAESPVPNKLAYLAVLFTGYRRIEHYDGAILPHSLPSAIEGESFVIRRRPPKGRIHRTVGVGDLLFNPHR